MPSCGPSSKVLCLSALLGFVAVESEKYEAGEAKKRMSDGGKGTAFVPPLEDHGKARDKAAAAVGLGGFSLATRLSGWVSRGARDGNRTRTP